jgi:hypothetical protein
VELVEWQKIETLKPLRLNGFHGLFLLTHESREAILLKSQPNPARTFFSSKFIEQLGLKTPRQRVLSAADDFQDFKQLMLGIDWATKHNPEHRRQIKQCL